MDLPPGPRAPAVWQTLAWMARPAAFLRAAHARFGEPVTIRTYWTAEPMVLFSSPAAIRDVFRLDPDVAPAGQSWEFLRPFAGPDSILLLDGEAHLRERRLLAGPFHGERMRAFAPIVAELARLEVGGWRGRVVTLERMRSFTLDVMLRVLFGAVGDDAVRMRAAIDGALGLVRSLPQLLAMALVVRDLGRWSPWGRFRAAVERFDGELYGLLRSRREASGGSGREASGGSGSALVDLLLGQRDASGRPVTDERVRDELVALLVGGHDTSAASLAWAFERLARHPAVMERLRAGDPAYLDAVVREVLRARPALTIAPRLLRAPVTIAGTRLPAGVQVAACIWLAMRRPDLWGDPGAFRPERWLGSDVGGVDLVSWIPFGGGVRRCAGAPFAEMELREVLRAAASLRMRPVVARGERARRSMLVVIPDRGGEVLIG